MKVKLWFFFSLDHQNQCLKQKEKGNNFSNFCFQIIYRYIPTKDTALYVTIAKIIRGQYH